MQSVCAPPSMAGERLRARPLRAQIGDHFPDLVGGQLLAPRRHQRSWAPVVDSPEHLLRIEFRRGEIGRDTPAFGLESVAVVAARVEKELAARLCSLGISSERIGRADLI